MAIQIFDEFLKEFEQPLTQFVSTSVQNLASAIDTPLRTAVTLWVVLYGIAILRGAIREPVMSFAWSAARVAVIVALATNASTFQSTVTDVFFEGLPKEIGSAITGAGLNMKSGQPFDQLLSKGIEVATKIYEQSGLTNIAPALIAAILMVFTAVSGFLQFAVMLYAKIGLALVIALGPRLHCARALSVDPTVRRSVDSPGRELRHSARACGGPRWPDADDRQRLRRQVRRQRRKRRSAHRRRRRDQRGAGPRRLHRPSTPGNCLRACRRRSGALGTSGGVCRIDLRRSCRSRLGRQRLSAHSASRRAPTGHPRRHPAPRPDDSRSAGSEQHQARKHDEGQRQNGSDHCRRPADGRGRRLRESHRAARSTELRRLQPSTAEPLDVGLGKCQTGAAGSRLPCPPGGAGSTGNTADPEKRRRKPERRSPRLERPSPLAAVRYCRLRAGLHRGAWSWLRRVSSRPISIGRACGSRTS